jgi:hypothetical protein
MVFMMILVVRGLLDDVLVLPAVAKQLLCSCMLCGAKIRSDPPKWRETVSGTRVTRGRRS